MSNTKPIEYVFTPISTAICGCSVFGTDEYRVVPCARHRGDLARVLLEAMTQ